MKSTLFKSLVVSIIAGFCMLSSSASALELGGVDIHGFISQGFIFSDDYNYLTNNSKDGSFDYNEIGINFSSQVTEKLRIGVQLYSRDLGDAGNNKITLDWAYGDYRFTDWFGIRAGRIKLPLGLYNETRDMDMLRTSAVLPQSVYPDMLRDTTIAANGGGIYGNVPMSSFGSIDYQAVIGVGTIDEDSGFGKFYNNKSMPMMQLDGTPDCGTAYVGSVKWNTPLDGLIVGVSGMKVDMENPVLLNVTTPPSPMTAELDTKYYTMSAEYTWEDLVLAAEYQTVNQKSFLPAVNSEREFNSEGYYLSASYRFTELFSMGAHYSVYYPNKDDKDGDNLEFEADAWEKDLALTLKFDVNDYLVVKIEGHHVNGTALVLNIDNPDKEDDAFNYGVAKVTFSF